MKRLMLLLFTVLVLTGGISAQSMDSKKVHYNAHSEVIVDSTRIAEMDEMPIYNPKSNAKIRIMRPPADLYYDMPIIGLNKLPDLRKNSLQKWPGNVGKNQKADTAESK